MQGQYDVTVSCLVNGKGEVIPFDPNTPPMMQSPDARELIPPKYNSVNDQGLFYQVPAGGGTFDIPMESGSGEEKK
jgi:hypothetical protein